MKKVVEVCCGSYYDALQASYGGASRIELNSALHMGGLTPVSYTHLDVYKRQALTLFAEKGYSAVYVGEIADAVGIKRCV